MGLNGLNFLRFLCFSHKLSVYDSKNGEHNDEEEEFSADEFVQRTLPFEEQSCEASSCRGSHISLVGDGHFQEVSIPI